MKICIVDDDRTTVERILRTIPWERYGITETCAAYDARGAREILSEGGADLLLCDIQMPGQSGLELMEWIRSEQPGVQVIFLSNYAEFSYAQRAMRLGSFDYICKGTDLGEVERAIGRCVEAVRADRENRRLRDMGENYESNAAAVEQQFYRDVLAGRLGDNAAALAKRGITLIHPVNGTMSFLMPVCVFPLFAPPFEGAEYTDAEPVVQRMLGECFLNDPDTGRVVDLRIEDRAYFCVILTEADEQGMLIHRGNDFIDLCRKRFGSAPLLYIGTREKKAHELGGYLRELTAFDRRNITCREGVLRFEPEREDSGTETLRREGAADPEAIRAIREHVLHGKEQEAKRCVRTALQEMVRAGIDKAGLEQWREAMRQAGYSVLTEGGLIASGESQRRLRSLEMRAADSVPDMIRWSDALVENLVSLLREKQKEADPAEEIRRYIETNYSDKIDREGIAAAAHLSPGYAAKLFKERYGSSMNEYVLEVRLQAAKRLLGTTARPVADIAQAVGFESAAYFITCFRKALGITPGQYREEQGSSDAQ